jgi:outer membrane receptor for ferrienterochelin and colicins
MEGAFSMSIGLMTTLLAGLLVAPVQAQPAGAQPARAQPVPVIKPVAVPTVAPRATQVPANDGVTIYDQKFFAQYGVVTARDMLERIPGTGAIIGALTQRGQQGQDAERRGLRSDTDQLLINGRRSTSKETDVTDFLERIPSAQVERIEVISGNVKAIDSSVSGRVVNIVLKGGEQGAGSGAYVAGVSYVTSGLMKPVGQLSYSFERGGFGATLGIETRPMSNVLKVNDMIVNPAGAPIGRFFENRKRHSVEYVGRLRTSYTTDGGASAQLTGYGLFLPRKNADTSELFAVSGAGESRLFNVQDRGDGHDMKYEVSTDIAVPLGASVKLLALGVLSRNEVEFDSTTFNVLTTPQRETDGDARNEIKTAKIARLTLQGDISPQHQIELGSEGANTKLDKDLDFFTFLGGRSFDVPVFNSDTMINEDRAEVFASYTWKPASSFEFEPGVAAEFSKLRQSGRDANVTRTFNFVKPSLSVWYTPEPKTRVFLSAVRDVGQLTFEDFAASFLREDNEVVAGNPNLVPEKAWASELGVEHRLPNDAGLMQAKIFYKRLSDVNDEVTLGPGVSGPGNLGSGQQYGLRVEWSFKLARMKLWDSVIGGNFQVQDSSVRDAFTGAKRRIGRLPEYEFRIDYRHDVSAWRMAYGGEFNKNGGSIESDFTRLDRRVLARGDLRIFLEKQVYGGVIARWFLGNVLSQRNTRDRVVYAVSQTDGAVLRREHREEHGGLFIGFRLRGSF